MTLLEFKRAHSGHRFITELFFYGFICKILRILLSIGINVNCRYCMIGWFEDGTLSFRSEVVYSLTTIRFNILFLLKIAFKKKKKKKKVLRSAEAKMQICI